MKYVEQKHTEHRFDGKARPGQFDPSRVPTFDLLDKVEVFAKMQRLCDGCTRTVDLYENGVVRFHTSPKYVRRMLSISSSYAMGVINLSTSSRQNMFKGLTYHAEVYSQYDGIHAAVSQSIIPTTLSPRAMIFRLLKSPCVKTDFGEGRL